MFSQNKKQLSLTISIFIILMLPGLGFSFSSEFEGFFNICTEGNSTVINNKADISIPDTNLTPLQRLYKQIKNYGKLELYLTENNKKLVIVPTNRLRLINRAPVVVQLLNEPEKPNFTFDLAPTSETTSANTEAKDETKTTADTNDKQHAVPVANVFTQQIFEHVVKYLEGNNAESQTSSFITIFQQPQSLTEILVSFAHKKSVEVKCLISSKSNISSRSYLCGKLLAWDSSVYALNGCYGVYNKFFARKKPKAATVAATPETSTAAK